MPKVLVVDDSPTAREMIATILQTDPEIEVVGKVANGREAVNFLSSSQIQPDIIATDINMPIMNGFELIEHVMAYHPTPILIVTVLNKDANFMHALHLGALDIIEKPAPTAWDQLPKVGIELIDKIKLLSRVKVITHLSGRKHLGVPQPESIESTPIPALSTRIVCIVSSTGGPNTLLKLLKPLPPNFPAPILIVQHMSEGFFIKGLIDWFRESLQLRVKQGEHGMAFSPGTVYVAPADRHMLLSRQGILLDNGPPVKNQKPSGDLLFKSAAEAFGSRVIAVVLTGIGDDGSEGVRVASQKGGTVIAQSRDTCVVPGMPDSAIRTNCVEKIIPLDDIAKEIVHLM